jgi:hypothetical protein
MPQDDWVPDVSLLPRLYTSKSPSPLVTEALTSQAAGAAGDVLG